MSPFPMSAPSGPAAPTVAEESSVSPGGCLQRGRTCAKGVGPPWGSPPKEKGQGQTPSNQAQARTPPGGELNFFLFSV